MWYPLVHLGAERVRYDAELGQKAVPSDAATSSLTLTGDFMLRCELD